MITRTGHNITLYVHFRSCMFLIPRIKNDCFVVMLTFTFFTVILQERYHEYSKGLLHCHPYLGSISEATSFRSQAKTLISLLFIVFYPCNILIIYLYSNKLHSIDIFFYKQHIKIFVLSKTLKTSPTCFGHYLTIVREILYLS